MRVDHTWARSGAPALLMASILAAAPLRVRAAGEISFADTVGYAAGRAAWAVASADFNRDNIPDLVIVNYYDDDIAVYLGHGDGTFSIGPRFPCADGPRDVDCADLNADGILDLVTSGYYGLGAEGIGVLIGGEANGTWDETFHAPALYATGNTPKQNDTRSVTVADFNADRILDIASANWWSSNVSVLFGQGSDGMGDGTFGPPTLYPTATGPNWVVAHDINGDGIVDLAAACSEADSVAVLFGNGSAGAGDGTFAPAVHFPAGDTPRTLVAFDIDEDGWPDLITANGVSDDLSVLLGNGDTALEQCFAYPLHIPVGESPHAVIVSDFNLDGLPDLAASLSHFSNGHVAVLPGRGWESGGNPFDAPLTFEVGSDAKEVVAQDLNADGLPDLALASYGHQRLFVLLNVTEIPDIEPPEPRVAILPNPFRDSTTIRITVGTPRDLGAAIYDGAGRMVRSFEVRRFEPGDPGFLWDGRDQNGRKLPSGHYFCRVFGDGQSAAGRSVAAGRITIAR